MRIPAAFRIALAGVLLLVVPAAAFAGGEASTFSFGGTPVFSVDKFGNVLAAGDPGTDTQPQAQLRAALSGTPDLDVEATGLRDLGGNLIPAGHGATLRQLLDQTTVHVTTFDKGGKVTGEVEGGVLCAGAREPLGKLFICLNRIQTALGATAPFMKELFKKKHRTPEEDQRLKDFFKLVRPVAALTTSLRKQASLDDEQGRLRVDLVDPGLSRPNATGAFEKDPNGSKGGALFAGKGTGSDAEPLLACVAGFNADGRTKGPLPGLDDDCHEGALAAFGRELGQLAAHPSVQGCFDRLRLAGLARFLDAHRALRGDFPSGDKLPGACAPVKDDVARLTRVPNPQRLLDSPAFRRELQAVAKDLKPRLAGLKTLHEFRRRTRLCEDSDVQLACADTPSGCNRGARAKTFDELVALAGNVKSGALLTDRARRALGSDCLRPEELKLLDKAAKEAELEVARTVAKYPLLGTGHKPTESFGESPPEDVGAIADAANDTELSAALERTSKRLAGQMLDAMSKFCDFANGNDFRNLVGFRSLQDEVAKGSPECGPVFDCASKEKERSDAVFNGVKSAFLMAGCIAGGLLPGAGVVVGPACAAAFFGDSALEARSAKKELQFTFACLAANSGAPDLQKTICSDKDFESAAARFESAVNDMYLNAAFAGFEGLSLLKHAAPFLKPSELEKLTQGIKEALKRGDVKLAEGLAKEAEGLVAARGGGAALAKAEASSVLAKTPELESFFFGGAKKEAEAAFAHLSTDDLKALDELSSAAKGRSAEVQARVRDDVRKFIEEGGAGCAIR